MRRRVVVLGLGLSLGVGVAVGAGTSGAGPEPTQPTVSTAPVVPAGCTLTLPADGTTVCEYHDTVSP